MDRDRSKYMTVAEARDALGVSKTKIAKLIRDGVLVTEPDVLDERVKLVLRADVERLLRASRPERVDDSKTEPAKAA